MKCENETNFVKWDDFLFNNIPFIRFSISLSLSGKCFCLSLIHHILTPNIKCIALLYAHFVINKLASEKNLVSYHLHANESVSEQREIERRKKKRQKVYDLVDQLNQV